MRNPHEMSPFVRWPLRLLSGPYAVATTIRNRLFDVGWRAVHRVPVPVVCVGNLTVGGTGKTPCVEWLAGQLADDGLAVCLVSRGYGAAAGPNDEAMLLEENLPAVPHLQNADRVAAARLAVDELEAEVIVLDDGFQHRRLHRDFDLLVVDATRPPQRDWCLPGGTLRERAGPGLRRADGVVLTRCDQADDVAATVAWLRTRLRPGVPIATTEHRAIDPQLIAGKPTAMLCGIGQPAAFRRTLESLGATIVAGKLFADHHAYTRDDVEMLRRWAESLPAETVIAVTQKDQVKLRLDDLAGRLVVPVRIGLWFRDGEAELLERIRAAVSPNG